MRLSQFTNPANRPVDMARYGLRGQRTEKHTEEFAAPDVILPYRL